MWNLNCYSWLYCIKYETNEKNNHRISNIYIS